MGINNHWRNKQIGQNFAKQELLCIDFIEKHKNLSWRWHGVTGHLYNYCKENFSLQPNGHGLIVINYPIKTTPKQFVDTINELIGNQTQAAYLAINRFEFVAVNDLCINYQDSIASSIEQIVTHICVPFEPMHFEKTEVDGNHFVGIHGLDIFTYESN